MFSLKKQKFIGSEILPYLFILFLLLYMLAVLLAGIWNSSWHRRQLMSKIDERLLQGALTANMILAEDFHDRAVEPGAIGEAEDTKNIERLSKFASLMGFQFVYTVIEKDGMYYLTSSSATPEELTSGEEVRYWEHYESLEQHVKDAMDSHGPVFLYHQDKWGTYRSVIVPMEITGGRRYAVMADYSIEYVMSAMNLVMKRSIIMMLTMLLIAVPFSVLIWYSGFQHRRILSRELQEEKRLEESLKLWRRAIDETRDAVIIAERATVFEHPLIYANRAFEEITGYSIEEAKGKDCRYLQGKDKDQPGLDEIRKALKENIGCKVVIKNYRKDGKQFWNEIKLSPICDQDGHVTHYVAFMNDITERLETERRLRHYEQILSVVEEPMGLVDKDLCYIEVNDAYAKLLEMKKEDLRGRKTEDILGDYYSKHDLGYKYAKVLEGQTVEFQSTYVYKGQERYYSVSYYPLRDQDGNVECITISGSEVTDLVLAQRATQQAQQRQQIILDTVPVTVFWKDRDSVYLGCNMNFAKGAGLKSPDDIIGRTDYELFGKESAELYRADDKYVMDTGESKLNFEEPMDLLDGTKLWLRTSKVPLRDNEGKIIGVLGTFEDVTEQRLAKDALELSEERLRLAIEGANEGLWDLNLVTGEVYYSPIWYTMLGYEPNELPVTFETWENLLHPDDKDNAKKQFHEMVSRGEDYQAEVRMRAKDGTYRWILGYGHVVARDSEGKSTRYAGTHMDITQRKEYEQMLSYRADFESLISQISGEFINLSIEQIDNGLENALAKIAEFVNVERSYIFQFSRDKQYASNTHEYCAPGTKSFKNDLLNIPHTRFSFVWEIIESGNIFKCEDIEKLPPQAKDIKEELRRESIQSVINVPMIVGENVVGLIGFDSVSQKAPWTQETLTLMKIVAGIFANTLDRKRAEESLREREEQLRLFVERAPASIAMFDNDMRYITVSNRWVRDYGLVGKKLLGRCHYEVFPEVPDRWKEIHQRCLAGEVISSEEDKFVRADGQTQWIKWEIRPWHSSHGVIGGIIMFTVDITERKRTEDALRESERKLKDLMGNLPGMAYRCKNDENWTMEFISEGCMEVTEYSPDEVIGNTKISYNEMILLEDRTAVRLIVDRAMEKHKRFQINYRIKTKSGDIKWIWERGTGVFDEEGVLLAMEGFMTDITKRKIAEQSITFRAGFEALLGNISREFITLSSDEMESGIRAALESISRYLEVESAGLYEYFETADLILLLQQWHSDSVSIQQVQSSQASRYPTLIRKLQNRETLVLSDVQDLPTTSKEGEKYFEQYKSVIITPIVSGHKTRGFLILGTVTEKREWKDEVVTGVQLASNIFAQALERQEIDAVRDKLTHELANKNNELESIIYVASHDLRSPLVNIQGFSYELRDSFAKLRTRLIRSQVLEKIDKTTLDIINLEVPENLGYIVSSATKMDSLMQGLLRVSRLGRTDLNLQTVDMNSLLSEVLKNEEYKIKHEQVSVNLEAIPECLGDPNQLTQVFTNLIENAIKYRSYDRPLMVSISGYVEDGLSIYCVEDNGKGIAPEHQSKIFEIFHRLEPGQTTGEGLGLTIVKRILDRHGGTIKLESQPGKGSKFIISLPRG